MTVATNLRQGDLESCFPRNLLKIQHWEHVSHMVYKGCCDGPLKKNMSLVVADFGWNINMFIESLTGFPLTCSQD